MKKKLVRQAILQLRLHPSIVALKKKIDKLLKVRNLMLTQPTSLQGESGIYKVGKGRK